MKKGLQLLAMAGLLILFAGTALAQEGRFGKFERFEMPGLIVHTYNSTEATLDGSAIFETDKGLVLLEPQPMPNSAKELNEYIANLKKPLVAVIVSYHGAGLTHYAGIPIYGSKATVEFHQNGGAARLFEAFSKRFPEFDTTVVVPNRTLEGKTANIGGIDFVLDYHNAPAPAPGMTISIPSAKVVYLHLLGGNSHSMLGSREHIDAYLGELRSLKARGYELILTSHHAPEKPEAFDKKIAYLEKTKEILNTAKTREDFIAAMKKAFPDYGSVGFLERSAGNLFK